MKPILIGLAGPSGAGKTTAAEYLRARHGFQVVSIGDYVKRELDQMLNIHGFNYMESEKEFYRPGLVWWTRFRQLKTSEDYWTTPLSDLSLRRAPTVVSDLREELECERLKSAGGITIRLTRNVVVRTVSELDAGLIGYESDYEIDNTLSDGGRHMFDQLDRILERQGEREVDPEPRPRSAEDAS